MARSRLVFRRSVEKLDLSGLSDVEKEKRGEEEKLRRKHMSPSSHLKLPPLLERRRQEFGITDGAFAQQPYNDTVLVYQLSRVESERVEGSSIILPETAQVREREQTPQGILVAAGLCALDTLRMNGMDLGHIVTFKRMAPWRLETDRIGSKYDEVLVFRVADIVGSLDLAESLRDGSMEVSFDKDNYEHHYLDKATGETWRPQQAPAFVPDMD